MLNNYAGKLRRFLAEENGHTAIEYMVMISIILVTCLVAINAIGNLTSGSLSDSSQSISNAFGP